MSNDPWAIQPKESKVNFAQCQIIRTEKNGNNGNTYFEMKFFLTPIEPEKSIVESIFYNFSPTFQKIIIPSVMKLVSEGKLDSAADLENSQKFTSYKWTEYKNYSNRDIKYWQDRNPDKLSVDDKGRTYKSELGIEFIDVYSDEQAWRNKAQSDTTENPVSAVQNNTTKEENTAVLAALPVIIQTCGTDMEKLAQTLNLQQFKDFDINSDTIKELVAKSIIDKCGSDTTLQIAMLVEINKDFDTPYLELGDFGLEQVPF